MSCSMKAGARRKGRRIAGKTMPFAGLRAAPCAVLLIVCAVSAPAACAEEAETFQIVTDQIPFPAGAATPETMLPAVVYVPSGPGRHPLAIINHGSPRNAADRLGMTAASLARQYKAPADWLAARGYVVVIFARRGYGVANASAPEGLPKCAVSRDYYNPGLVTARDIEAAVAAMQAKPFVDPARVVLFGHSAGGWGALAAMLRHINGVVAVVNFAGGRGSDGPDTVCQPDNLVAAVGHYGAGAQVPNLWIYAANDHFFGPELAHRMFAAFTADGAGKARFVAGPASGKDGHRYFTEWVARWSADVGPFLGDLGLPH
jgi:dienelactone hydrolase